jgi:CRP-like cAMP-binding protein
MSAENEEQTASSELTRAPGESFWSEGEAHSQPLLIRRGIVAYRAGAIALGFLGPGQIALPIPGVPSNGPAAAELVALTEATAVPIDLAEEGTTPEQLAVSSRAVLEGARRLGNMSLPQRLAALLLDITELTGQPMVGCRQDILAMAASARRETVATILSGWRDQDWIQTRYRRCKVLDRDALTAIRDGAE